MDWRRFFFGGPPPAAKPPAEADAAAQTPPSEPAPVGDASAGNGGEAIYAHVPETQLRSSQQHRWLFDDGVQYWNRHRHEKDFKPNFSGVNFVKEAAKTRLWGRPIDLAGEERAVLTGIDLSHADLQGCTFAKADLRDAKLIGAHLRNANLAGANLSGADLSGCDLRGANLDGAQLARAKLTYANLTGASLKDANLAWADLNHAIVGMRNLQEANLFGASRNTIAPAEKPQPHPQIENITASKVG